MHYLLEKRLFFYETIQFSTGHNFIFQIKTIEKALLEIPTEQDPLKYELEIVVYL